MGASNRSSIGVGVIGFGFMGRTHIRAYAAANAAGHPNRLVAVCDRNAERLRGDGFAKGNIEEDDGGPLFDADATQLTDDPAELFASDAVELVSICTHTDTHVDLALRALESGKHVLVEKPVALHAADIDRLAAAARASERVCMPAMCMRFWPGWTELKHAVDAGEYGRVRSAVFRRLGSHPAWSPEFYLDSSKSGGALFDLHVHDADLVRWLFGAPRSVTSIGTFDHVSTAYAFDDGPAHVVAEGGWDHTPGFPFHMGYTVVFERATLEFALGREHPLVLARDGNVEPLVLADGTGYDGEVRHVLALCRGEGEPRATIDESAGLARMLDAERESLETRSTVPC